MQTAPVILCPGQGAQAVGMGKAWADAVPEAKAIFDRADVLLGDRLGAPLSTLCFEGPEADLNTTAVAQPALYTCAVAAYRGWLAQEGAALSDVQPTATAGLSLGEYTALHLAGAFEFEVGLELVVLRGRAMQDAAEATASGMVALIGATPEQAHAVADAARGSGVLVPANFNAPGQVVLSGDTEACARAETEATKLGLRAAALAVAGAFHSPIMAPAAERLRQALASAEIAEPRCPVYSNVTGAPHAADADSIRAKLVEQLTSPVLWADTAAALVSSSPAGSLHELAPGKTLAGLMRRIDRGAKVTTHDAPA